MAQAVLKRPAPPAIRETRLFMTAPVNNNLVLAFIAEHVLGMPRSY